MSRSDSPASPSPGPELSRPVPLAQIGARTERDVVATAAECGAVAARLLIPAVAALSCRFHLAPAPGGAILAEGRLHARVTRECVVTLELFEAPVDEAFRLRFVPEENLSDDDDLLDVEADDEVPYHGTLIDIGEAAVEQLALALDPYPRMPGAELEMPDDDADGGAPESPFAALARRGRPG